MQIETAIQQYLIGLKAKAARERVEFDLVVLARLQEYLDGDAGIGSVDAIREQDLRRFIGDWYRAGEDVTPETAEGLVRAVLGWAQWLDEDILRSAAHELTSPWLAALPEELSRTCEATLLLDRPLRREDLGEPLSVDEEESDASFETITAGATRVI